MVFTKILFGVYVMVKNNEQAIREAAYFIWQNAGCPQGQDEYFWSMAVEQFNNSNSKSSSSKSSSAAKKCSSSKKCATTSCKTKSSSCKSSSSAKKSSK